MQSVGSSLKVEDTQPTSLNFTRQGSLRKVIPGQYNNENKFEKKKEELNSTYKYINQEYAVLAEYKMIQSENIQGVYVIPSSKDCLKWFGVIFVRRGLYKDGVFRFNIILDPEFPNSDKCPTIKFESKMFHPAVNSEDNTLDLDQVFSNWKKDENHLWQVMKFLQWMFENVEGSMTYGSNKEAITLFKQLEAYKEKVKEVVSVSLDQLYEVPDDDPHYLIFEVYNEEIHNQARAELLLQNDDEFFSSNNSWVLAGSTEPLSRPPTPDIQSNS